MRAALDSILMDAQPQSRNTISYSFRIRAIDGLLETRPSYDSVERARVKHWAAKRARHIKSNRALAGSRRPIDGNNLAKISIHFSHF